LLIFDDDSVQSSRGSSYKIDDGVEVYVAVHDNVER